MAKGMSFVTMNGPVYLEPGSSQDVAVFVGLDGSAR